MSRRPFYFAVPALLACVVGHAISRPAAEPRLPAARQQHAAERSQDERPRTAARATRSRYRLSSDHRAILDGREAARVTVEGTWTTTDRASGGVEVEFAAERIEAVGDQAPAPAEVADPFLLAKHDGQLLGVGFAKGVPGKARDLLTSLAATFQCTARSDATWTVEEEDLSGRYEAIYTREGHRIERRRGRTTETRGANGLESTAGEAIQSDERSEFLFDAEGLVRATVKLTRTHGARKPGRPSVKLVLVATLTREDAAAVPLTRGVALLPEAITSHVDHAAIARSRHEALVAGARADELIDAARSAAHLGRDVAGADQQRSRTVRRLSALVQLDGGSAGELASAIRRDPSDREAIGLLAGALSSAPTPDATRALTSLLSDPLPEEARSAVLANLALAASPTDESAAALTKELDKPLGGQAALALGAEARKLGDDGAGGDAVSLLLQRYEAATRPEDKTVYLQALANTGSRRALPVMLAAIAGNDFGLARAGALGLRLIPGDDVDDALWALIQSASPVMFEALSAVGYRAPALWEPRLLEAKEVFKDQKRVVEAIRALLTQWGNLHVPAPQ